LQANSEIIRRWAIEVLGRIKDPQAVGLLVRLAQQDEDWWVREKAIEALGELGDKRVTPYLLDLMNESPELLLSSLRALAALEATESTTHILPLLHTSPPDVQLAILECLEAFHCIDCAGDVMPLLQAESPEVSRAAFQLLNRWEARAKQQADPFLSLSGSPLDQILIAAHKAQGEDLLLAPNRKAYIKQHGNIQPLSEHIFRAEQLESILIPHLNANQLEQLQNINDIDFSYDVSSHNLRFRAHLFYQHGGLSAVFRHIDSRLASFDKLGLPSQVKTFSKLNHGLVIVGGPTGSGKSTTLAAIINDINRHSNRHIISLEDPNEVLHSSEKSLVNQREIGSHTLSFEKALRSALRQDPDVILVGEMRDLTTISLAITAAETGHLVFGTLHTVSAETTVDRVINAFPAHQQEQIRSMLAQSLKAVVCQYLLKRKDQNGRCLASEVMLNTDAIGNLIRKAKQFQISSVIATSREAGMHLMDHDLMRLYEEGLVYADEVYMKAKNKQDFEKLLAEEEFGQRNRVSSSMSVVVGTALKH
jgi:twitching motility protein PilT